MTLELEENNKSVTENDILNFEHTYQLRVPARYRQFLYQSNGGVPKHKRYKLTQEIPQIGYGELYIPRFESLEGILSLKAGIEESSDIYGVKELLGRAFYINRMLPIAYAGVGETYLFIGTDKAIVGNIFWVILSYDGDGQPYKEVLLETDFHIFLSKLTS